MAEFGKGIPPATGEVRVNISIPNHETINHVLKTIRGHKNLKHTPYYLREIITEAGLDYGLYQRWMRAGNMMVSAPSSEIVNFIGTHVLQRHCTRFYEEVQEQLDTHTISDYRGCPHPAPQVFITTTMFGMSVTDYLLQFLYGGYYLGDACSMVGITKPLFWLWFRRGRLGDERYKDFYDRMRYCLMLCHVFTEQREREDGESKVQRRRPKSSPQRRSVRKVVRKRVEPMDDGGRDGGRGVAKRVVRWSSYPASS